MGAVRRHALPICCTAALIFAAWVILSLPMVAVFLFDKQFALPEYLEFLLYAAGMAIGASAAIMFPLSLGFERLAQRAKWRIVAVPLLPLMVSIFCLPGRILLTGDLVGTVFGWAGLLFALSLVFSFYWMVLWLGRGFICSVRKIMRQASA